MRFTLVSLGTLSIANRSTIHAGGGYLPSPVPVVVEIDRVIGALQWMTREMDKRYHMFAQVGSRNLADYNAKMKLQGGKKLPLLVIVIDELADLMMREGKIIFSGTDEALRRAEDPYIQKFLRGH